MVTTALLESAQGPFGTNHCQCGPLLSLVPHTPCHNFFLAGCCLSPRNPPLVPLQVGL